jgi:pimeloyl-ACP methyl ester carboxylesterase
VGDTVGTVEREPTEASERPSANLVEAGSGAPLLCLHGWGASSELFAPLGRALGDRRRLLMPDLPGFGATAKPPEPWDVASYASWVCGLMDRLGLVRVDILGHSFGGSVALYLAATVPDRVGHLVLAGSAGVRQPPSLRARVRIRVFKLSRHIGASRLLPSALRAVAARRAGRAGSRDYRAAQGVMRPTFVRIVNQDLRPLMPHISAPTLLVWGDRDDETPIGDGREMETLIPDAGLVVLRGGTHYAYIEQSTAFAHIVATFLGAPLATLPAASSPERPR